jgi:hypothetical protein
MSPEGGGVLALLAIIALILSRISCMQLKQHTTSCGYGNSLFTGGHVENILLAWAGYPCSRRDKMSGVAFNDS